MPLNLGKISRSQRPMLFSAICCFLWYFIIIGEQGSALRIPSLGTRQQLCKRQPRMVKGCPQTVNSQRYASHSNTHPLYMSPFRTPDDIVTGEDSAMFKLEEQRFSEWSTFAIAVSSVMSVVYFSWFHPGGPALGNLFVNTMENLSGGSSMLAMCYTYGTFAAAHSGLAWLRPYAETIVGARVWRYVFALFSLPLAATSIIYFLNHRYDGDILWNVQQLPGTHSLLWLLSFVSFFFLYPSTFNLLEVAAVKKPTLHLWESGIARITRHPQMVGQLLWCLAHTAYVGTSFLCVTSALLCAHHAFGVWHGDARLRDKFGAAAAEYQARTSIVPFAAILDGRQQLPKDYYKEFLRLPYLVVAIGSVAAYLLHPLILTSASSVSW